MARPDADGRSLDSMVRPVSATHKHQSPSRTDRIQTPPLCNVQGLIRHDQGFGPLNLPRLAVHNPRRLPNPIHHLRPHKPRTHCPPNSCIPRLAFYGPEPLRNGKHPPLLLRTVTRHPVAPLARLPQYREPRHPGPSLRLLGVIMEEASPAHRRRLRGPALPHHSLVQLRRLGRPRQRALKPDPGLPPHSRDLRHVHGPSKARQVKEEEAEAQEEAEGEG